MLPKEATEEYQRLYKQVFGEMIPTPEAEKAANDLVGLYKAVYAPELFGQIIHKAGVVGESPENKTGRNLLVGR